MTSACFSYRECPTCLAIRWAIQCFSYGNIALNLCIFKALKRFPGADAEKVRQAVTGQW